jgi:hypothetical protein
VVNDDSNVRTESQAPTPYPGLKPLDRLVGTWKVSGEAEGETTYEWMEGGPGGGYELTLTRVER